MSTVTAPAPTTRAPGALPFAAAGLLFVAYPVLRPWADQTPDGMPEAFASPAWLVAHLSAAAGFLLVEADDPNAVRGLLLPFSDLVHWDVRAIVERDLATDIAAAKVATAGG